MWQTRVLATEWTTLNEEHWKIKEAQMKTLNFLGVLILVFSFVSCASLKTPASLDTANKRTSTQTSPVEKPDWVSSSGCEATKEFYSCVADYFDENLNKARDMARDRAITEIVSNFAPSEVSITSRREFSESSSHGIYFQVERKGEVRRENIRVENPDIELHEELIEKKEGKYKHKVYARVSFPRRNIDAISIRYNDITGWGIKKDIPYLKKDLISGVMDYAKKTNLNLNPSQTEMDDSFSLKEQQENLRTANFLAIELVPEEPVETTCGRFIVKLKLGMKLSSLVDRRLVNNVFFEEFGSGHNIEKAYENAMKKILAKLSPREIATEKEGDKNVSPALVYSNLGRVGIAEFVVAEQMYYEKGSINIRGERKNADNANLTRSFNAGLEKFGIDTREIIIDVETVDKMMKGEGGIYGFKENGLDVLIIGEYKLDFRSRKNPNILRGAYNLKIPASDVNFQEVRIKGYCMRTKTGMFDIRVRHDSRGKALHQRSFLSFVAEVLNDAIARNEYEEVKKYEQ
jgi:hypothetical protein